MIATSHQACYGSKGNSLIVSSRNAEMTLLFRDSEERSLFTVYVWPCWVFGGFRHGFNCVDA